MRLLKYSICVFFVIWPCTSNAKQSSVTGAPESQGLVQCLTQNDFNIYIVRKENQCWPEFTQGWSDKDSVFSRKHYAANVKITIITPQ